MRGVPLVSCFGGNRTSGPLDVASARSSSSSPSGRLDFATETFVVGALPFDTTQISSRANFSNPRPGDPCHPLAAGAHAPCVASIAVRGRGEGAMLEAREDGTANTILGPSGGRGGTGCGAVAIGFHGSQDPDVSGDVSHPVGRNQGQECCVNLGLHVRRLTPLECERLMGWPDDYTAWGIDDAGRRVEMSDGPRYRMCGNGVGRQHGEWLARRIVDFEAGSNFA